jgi:hypothetical protein
LRVDCGGLERSATTSKRDVGRCATESSYPERHGIGSSPAQPCEARFQERIGEAEIEDIHDRLFPEEVIDAENRVFREHRVRDAVELLRRGQVTSERLFDNDTRMLGQVRGAESFDDSLAESTIPGCRRRSLDLDP